MRACGGVQADVPTPPAEEESQFQQITAARKYIAEQALKQQAKKVNCSADLPVGSNQCVPPVGLGSCMMSFAVLLAVRWNVMPGSAEFGADTDRPTDRHMHTHTACICNLHTDKQGNADAPQSCLPCVQNWVHVRAITCLQSKGIHLCLSSTVAGCFLLASWLQQPIC
jgi:hypothetical protein